MEASENFDITKKHEALKPFQEALGTKQDGWIGEETLKAVDKIDAKIGRVIRYNKNISRFQINEILDKLKNPAPNKAKNLLGKAGAFVKDNIAGIAERFANQRMGQPENGGTVQIGYVPPPPRTVPAGVWIAGGLVVLLLILFFVFRKSAA